MKELINKLGIKRLIIFLAIAIILIMIVSCLIWYFSSISPVNKNNQEEIEITIPRGSVSTNIADILKENNLIKNEFAFRIYIKLNNVSSFKAGTYYFKQSMSLKEIIRTIETGSMNDPSKMGIVYLEGKNFRWLASAIAEATNNTEEDVYNTLNNEEYIDSLIEKYWFINDEIKNGDIYYSLEGYLFPDTYSIESRDATVEEIFNKMLDRMEAILDEYKDEIESKGYNVHKILTIASIIEMESINSEDRKDVSSVIYNRLKSKMPIQSDVTTYYAFKVDVGERDLYNKEIYTYNPYNTRGPDMEGKIPVGPISSVSKSSIEAALNPNDTDYLFFVADKNGKMYFSKTNSEHSQLINKLKDEGLWLEY